MQKSARRCMVSCGHRFLHRPSRRRDDRTSSTGPRSFHAKKRETVHGVLWTPFFAPTESETRRSNFEHRTSLVSCKKARDGAWCPVDTVFCTDRVGDETIELRAQDCARFMQKGISSRISLCMKKARDGDRTRDPLLGKEVLHR